MSKHLDVSVIIQGPTKYFKEVVGAYSGVKNVLWCTWKDEPQEVIRAIEESGVYVHLIEKPKKAGYWNVNFQCKSTYEGLLRSKELFGTEYYLKVRSDFYVTNISLLFERFLNTNEAINFIGWANVQGGYFLDYVVFGDYFNMEKYWRFSDLEDNGRPCPEIFLMKSFFGDNCLSTQFKMNRVSRFPLLNDIKFNWVSRGINIRDFSSKLEFNYTEKRILFYFKFKIKNLVDRINNIIKH